MSASFGGRFIQGQHDTLVDGAGNQTIVGSGAYSHQVDGPMTLASGGLVEITAGGGGHLK